MQFRRSGQRDERRRRVLIDETRVDEAKSEDSSPPGGTAAGNAATRRYSAAALESQQPPVTQLIPKGIWSLVGIFFIGVLAISGIEAFYTTLYLKLPADWQQTLSSLHPTAAGSLASWFASATLLAAACAAVMAFSLRRHRLDDYRGRYRVWLWAAILLGLASFDASSHVRNVVAPLLVTATGFAPWGHGAVWTSIVSGLVLSICLTRLAFEVWESRPATTFLALAAAGYLATAIASYHPSLTKTESVATLVRSSSLLAGHFLLAYSIMLFCRHVYLEAQGASAKPRIKSKTEKKAKETTGIEGPKTPTIRRATLKSTESRGSKTVRVDASHQKSASRPPEKEKAQPAPPTPTFVAEDDSEPKLSKAERRRLRKLERRQKRQEAET